MELIIYQGELTETALERWRRSADDAGITLHVSCCTGQDEVEHALEQRLQCESVNTPPAIPFRSSDGFHLLRISEILCLKGSDHKVVAYLKDGREIQSRTLRESTSKSLSPFLETGQFLQTQSAAYVNINYIDTIKQTSVRLLNGKRFPVSYQFYREFASKSIKGTKESTSQ